MPLRRVKEDIIVWKSAWKLNDDGTARDVIVKLLIPKNTWYHITWYHNGSPAFSLSDRKLRFAKAKVLDIQSMSGRSLKGSAVSTHDVTFKYRRGKVVRPTNGGFAMNDMVCDTGIHAFWKRKDAVAYA